jgi:(p)ppGpp synthase/HD superfamily hydrolase
VPDLIERAKEFATVKHQVQKRKFGGGAYIIHPTNVAKRVQEFTSDSEIIAAAYLHDTVEDTKTTFNEIFKHFGTNVGLYVFELTSDKVKAKKQGKAKYLRDKINSMSIGARLVKFADREDNVSDLDKDPPEFRERYATETEYILDHLIFKPTQYEESMITSIRQKIRPFLPLGKTSN